MTQVCPALSHHNILRAGRPGETSVVTEESLLVLWQELGEREGADLCLTAWLRDVLQGAGDHVHVRSQSLDLVLQLQIARSKFVLRDRSPGCHYRIEDRDDGDTIPVIRLHGLAQAPETLLVVNKLDLHGKGDFTPGVF